MADKLGYSVENDQTGEWVKTVNPIEYGQPALWWQDICEAMTAATYFSTVTGINHVVVGPHPKPHA